MTSRLNICLDDIILKFILLVSHKFSNKYVSLIILSSGVLKKLDTPCLALTMPRNSLFLLHR